VFPPLALDGTFIPEGQQEYSAFAYWREPLPSVELAKSPDQEETQQEDAVEVVQAAK